MKKLFLKIALILLTLSTSVACDDSLMSDSPNKSIEYGVVNLGLSSGTLWADRNVGAKEPEDYGCYFAWGETETKSRYSWNTYKWCDGSSTSINKYSSDDSLYLLLPEDDAAAVNMGLDWRMPTAEEQKELIEECSWIWTTKHGTKGYKVVGPNGNSIFLPASGYCVDSHIDNTGTHGSIWSSSLANGASYNAKEVYFYSDSVDYKNTFRFYGLTVRAVSTFNADNYVDNNDGGNNDDDGNNDDGGNFSSDEYLEITMNGKTLKYELNGSESHLGEFNYLSRGTDGDFDLTMYYYDNIDKVANSTTGNYRFGEYSEDIENFDFSVNYKNAYSKSGTHNVTSIKKKGDVVIVKGKFNGILSDGNKISGSYCIELGFLQ